MILKDFIYEFNLATTMTTKNRDEWMNILNNKVNRDIDYSDSISLYHLVDSFNKLYQKFKNEYSMLPNLRINGYKTLVKYYSSKVHDYEKLVMSVDNLLDDRFSDGGILYLQRCSDLYIGYITNGLLTREEGFVKKYLEIDKNVVKRYLEIGNEYSVLIEWYHYFKNRQVFANWTSMMFTKINGNLLDDVNTFEISLGNVYFNKEDYVNIVFKFCDKLEIDYDNSIVKLDNMFITDKNTVINEMVKKIYVNMDMICSCYEFGRKEVNNNIKKLLIND